MHKNNLEQYQVFFQIEKQNSQLIDFYVKVHKQLESIGWSVGHTLSNIVIDDASILLDNAMEDFNFFSKTEENPVFGFSNRFSILVSNYATKYIEEFIDNKISFLQDNLIVNRLELLLKLRVFFVLHDNVENEFNILNYKKKPIDFEVKFMYACPGNSLIFDSTKKYYNMEDIDVSENDFSFCFHYNIKFKQKEIENEIVKITVWNISEMRRMLEELLAKQTTGIILFPSYCVIKKIDISKINSFIYDFIEEEGIRRASSKHELMLHLARTFQINNLDYWLNEPINQKYVDNNYIEITDIVFELT